LEVSGDEKYGLKGPTGRLGLPFSGLSTSWKQDSEWKKKDLRTHSEDRSAERILGGRVCLLRRE
jgi:hypothetical protein